MFELSSFTTRLIFGQRYNVLDNPTYYFVLFLEISKLEAKHTGVKVLSFFDSKTPRTFYVIYFLKSI